MGPAQTVQLERALCHKLVECGCGAALRADGLSAPIDCDGWTLETLIGPATPYYYDRGYGYGDDDYAEPLPLSLDEDCIARIAELVERQSCDSVEIRLGCEDACRPFFGPGLEGQPCSSADACGRGLVCAGNECRDPCQVVPVREGERCDSFGCVDGFACRVRPPADFPSCVRLPGVGEACDEGECVRGAWCDDSDPALPLCTPLQADGAPCSGHRQCESGLCPAGSCAARPSAGMPCSFGVCGPDSACVGNENGGEGTCVPTPPLCRELLPTVLSVLSG